MTAEELYKIVADRGLTIKIDDQGRPCASGAMDRLTPALIDALKVHRKEILTMLGLGIAPPKPIESETPPEMECLWPGNDYVAPHWFPAAGWPVGAFFFRKNGDLDWKPIPGRTWNKDIKRGTVERKS